MYIFFKYFLKILVFFIYFAQPLFSIFLLLLRILMRPSNRPVYIFHNGYILPNPVSLPVQHPSDRHCCISHNEYIFPCLHPYVKSWLYSVFHRLLPEGTSLCRKICRYSKFRPVWAQVSAFSQKIMSRSHGGVPDVWKEAEFLLPVFRPDRYIHRMPVRRFRQHLSLPPEAAERILPAEYIWSR